MLHGIICLISRWVSDRKPDKNEETREFLKLSDAYTESAYHFCKYFIVYATFPRWLKQKHFNLKI